MPFGLRWFIEIMREKIHLKLWPTIFSSQINSNIVCGTGFCMDIYREWRRFMTFRNLYIEMELGRFLPKKVRIAYTDNWIYEQSKQLVPICDNKSVDFFYSVCCHCHHWIVWHFLIFGETKKVYYVECVVCAPLCSVLLCSILCLNSMKCTALVLSCFRKLKIKLYNICVDMENPSRKLLPHNNRSHEFKS